MSNLTAATPKSILIIDEHPLFRSILRQIIERDLGMGVCGEADTEMDAIGIIDTAHPDAVIMEIAFNGTSGIDLIKKIKRRNAHVSILVVSAHDENIYAERVLRAGARGYIEKAAPLSEVLAAVRDVMEGRIYLSRAMNTVMLEMLGKSVSPVKPDGMESLADRELEVFKMVGRGLNSREISEALGLKKTTVESYRERVKVKLKLKNATALYQYSARWIDENEPYSSSRSKEINPARPGASAPHLLPA
jgi:DNA-binding NarL/FixJ family response regulator